MLIISVLVFTAAMLGMAGLYVALAPNRLRQRLQTLAPSPAGTDWTQTVVKLAGPLASLSTPSGEWDQSALRIRLLNAGIRREDAPLLYFGAKTALPLLMAGLAYAAVRSLSGLDGSSLLLVLGVSALLGSYVPNLFLALLIRQRQREIFETFPDATDLMLVCMEAGLGLDAALVRVTDEIKVSSQALAEELHLTQLEMRAGASREQALRHLGQRTGVPEIASFAVMLKQADKFGTSLGDSLRVYSDELRHTRMTRAEELAAKVPTKMLLPLVLCIFPAIIMVVMGPAVIRVIRTLMPMLGGG